MPVRRDWLCLNPACGHDFESDGAQPECPKCRCIKTRWRPSGGHIQGAATKHADRTLRSVAADFGLSNLKSARQGEAAHPGQPWRKTEGTYFGIPFSPNGATSGFAADQPTMRIGAPANGPRFKKPAGNKLPTRVVAVDDRKIG